MYVLRWFIITCQSQIEFDKMPHEALQVDIIGNANFRKLFNLGVFTTLDFPNL